MGLLKERHGVEVWDTTPRNHGLFGHVQAVAHRDVREHVGRGNQDPPLARMSPPFHLLANPRGHITTTVYDWRHYLAIIQRKPGALRNGAPFAELPPAFHTLQQRMLKTPGSDRKMVDILALVLQNDEQAVLAAVELALEAGAPTKTHILNLLHRRVGGKPIDAPPVKPSSAPKLTTEPRADVERYDGLCEAWGARHAS